MSDEEVSARPEVSNVDFRDKKLFEKLQANDKCLHEAFLCLALCHTVEAESEAEEVQQL